jgi:pimeloyl-ACP methyl ester carboxylesterase
MAPAITARPTGRGIAPPAFLVEPARGAAAPPPLVPARGAIAPPPLVIVHGITRDAEGIARRLAPRALAQGRTLVAPLFAAPDFQGYQRVFGRRRADLALLALLDGLVAEGRLPRGPVDLAGFSGGAQFAHRFAWLYPHRVGRLTLASPGWWTFPDAAPFPYGLGRSPEHRRDVGRWLRACLPEFLDRPITVAVGAADNRPDDHTRGGAAIDAQQGRDRLTRARRWTAAMRAAAERHGIEPRIAFRALPGAGHDFGACADAGLDALLLPSA